MTKKQWNNIWQQYHRQCSKEHFVPDYENSNVKRRMKIIEKLVNKEIEKGQK